MKQRGFKAKAVLTLFATLVLLCTLCSYASAADTYKNLGCAYGQAVPTDKSYEDAISKYNFYGDEAVLHIMQISKGKKNAYYAVEIYSDKNYTNKIRTLNVDFPEKAGHSSISINWPFKDTQSGTYYGKCYSYTKTTKNGEAVKTIDSDSISTFTININRVGKKAVKLTSVSNSSKGVKIAWEKMPTAEYYYVYRKAPGEKSWSRIKTLDGDKSYYVDTTAKSGKKYTYTVKCKDNKYTSLYNKTGLSVTYLKMPTPKVGGAGANGYAKLSWTKVTGADGYYVYRKGGTLSDYTWERIATVKSGNTLTYTDKTAKNTGWNYTYTVRAYKGKTLSSYLAKGVDFNYVKAPTLKSVTNYDGGLKISWSCSDADVTEFYVYRKSGSSWKYIGKTKNKYYIDKKATAGAKNTYTVKAITETNAGAYNSKGITQKYIPTPQPTKPVFNRSYHATVKWNAVKGATGYNVYRKVNVTGNWKKIATLNGRNVTSYVDKSGKSPNTSYTYTIRAFDKSGLLSAYDKQGATTVCLVMPIVKLNQISTPEGELKIRVSWNEVEGASKYRVYKCIEGGTLSRITDTSDTSFIDENELLNNITYKYVVRAIHQNGDMSYYRTAKTITPLTIPVITSVTASDTDGTEIIWNSVGASEYVVYRRAADSTKWEEAGRTTTTAFTDNGEEALGNHYYYAVSAMYGKTESIKSAELGNFTELTADSEYVEDQGIKLSWSCTEGAVITIGRAEVLEEGTSEFITISGDFANNEFLDTDLTPGSTYVYNIVAAVEGKVSATASTTCKRLFPRLEPVALTVGHDANLTNADFTVSWTTVENAEEYILEYSENQEEWAELTRVAAADIGEGEDAVYEHKGLEPDTTYYYRVTAVNEAEERPSSQAVISCIAYAPVGDVINLGAIKIEGFQQVKIKWNVPDNAEGYKIYRKTVDAEWNETPIKIIAEKTTTSFIDNTIEESGSYVYKVEAYAENRASAYNTTEASVVTVEIKATEITSITAAEDAYTVINWDHVGAAAYVVERKAVGSDEWVEVATVEQVENGVVTSYEDSDEDFKGVKCYYRVSAKFGNKALASEEKANFVELTLSVQQEVQKGIKLVFSSSTEGATTSVERQTGDGEFQLVALDSHPVNKLVSFDKNVESGVTYTYKLIGKADGLLDGEICKSITRN